MYLLIYEFLVITCCIARNRQSVQDSQENTNGNYGMNVREAFRELLENKCEKAGGDAQVQKLYVSLRQYIFLVNRKKINRGRESKMANVKDLIFL